MQSINEQEFKNYIELVLGEYDFGLILHYVARGLEDRARGYDKRNMSAMAQVSRERADILRGFLEDKGWYGFN